MNVPLVFLPLLIFKGDNLLFFFISLKLKDLLFGGHCLREVFQTLHDYNLSFSLMTLTLFQGHRYVRT